MISPIHVDFLVLHFFLNSKVELPQAHMNRANECFIYMLFKHLTTLWDPFQNDLKWHHYFMRKIGTANPLEQMGYGTHTL